tara:strand:- start:3380 stop:3586 length:207 start_codon:yes stop_codon:yes gene_type:complete
MAFISKTFIQDAHEATNADGQVDGRGNDSLSKRIEDWLTSSSAVSAKVTVGSCSLNGDRVFVVVIAET